MPTSYHPFIRQFQKCKEDTGRYNSLPTVGYTLRVAQENANRVAKIVAKVTTYFCGAKQVKTT